GRGKVAHWATPPRAPRASGPAAGARPTRGTPCRVPRASLVRGKRSWQLSGEERGDAVRHGGRQVPPHRGGDSERRPVGRRGRGDVARRPLQPGKRDVRRAPLLLEAVRAAAGRAAAEVEHPYVTADDVLQERPVQQHVGRESTVL